MGPWLGINFYLMLGLATVPTAKLCYAPWTPCKTRSRGPLPLTSTAPDWPARPRRSLFGYKRNIMVGLYEPHNLESGVAAFGPSSTVVPARARATAWASAGRQTAMAAGRAGGSGSHLCERRQLARRTNRASGRTRVWRPSQWQARALPKQFAGN